MLPISFDCSEFDADVIAAHIISRKLLSIGYSDFHVLIGHVITEHKNAHRHVWLQNSMGTLLDPVGVARYGQFEDNFYQMDRELKATDFVYEYLEVELSKYISNETEVGDIKVLLDTCNLRYLEAVKAA